MLKRTSCQYVPKYGNMLKTIDKINGKAKKIISQKAILCPRQLSQCTPSSILLVNVTRCTSRWNQGQSFRVKRQLLAHITATTARQIAKIGAQVACLISGSARM